MDTITLHKQCVYDMIVEKRSNARGAFYQGSGISIVGNVDLDIQGACYDCTSKIMDILGSVRQHAIAPVFPAMVK